MIFKFEITLDTETGEYKSDAQTTVSSSEKGKFINVQELSGAVGKMFAKLARDYSAKILRQNLHKVKMN